MQFFFSDYVKLNEILQFVFYNVEELNAANKLTCKEDTVEVFNASINLVGHHKAGMTSLATRLMEQEFKIDVQSNEAMSIHLVKSTFNKNEKKLGKWSETALDSSSYMKNFSNAVLAKSSELRKRRTIQRPNLPLSAKNVANTNSDFDIQKSGVENPQQPMKHTANNLRISDSKLTSDKQKNTNTAQKQTKSDTDENTADKETGTSIPKTKTVQKQIMAGDPSTSTLDEQLMKEIMTYKTNFPGQQSDDHSISICLRDFCGYNKLITTQQHFLDAESATLIVMDITKSLNQRLESNHNVGNPNSPSAVLHCWLHSLHVKASQQHQQPNVALILTHRDMIQDDDAEMYVNTYIKDILNTLHGNPYAKFITKDNIYVVDSKSGSHTEFTNLQNNLFQNLTQQSTWGKEVPVRWMKLKADMIDESLKEGQRFLSLANVIGQAKQYGLNEKETESFLHMETTLGNFIYYPESELRDIVITDPKWLFDKVTTLTTKHNLNKQESAAETVQDITSGYVIRKSLQEIWNERKVEYLIQLMIGFNLIIPMDDSGQRYIIPCMLPPQKIKTQKRTYENMEIIYSEFHKFENGLLIKILHQLMSECSKIWKLCTDQSHPSYTDASFEMKKGIKLELTMVDQDSLQISISCSKTVFKQDMSQLIHFFREPRHILSMKMEQLGIEQADTFYTLCPYSKSIDIHSCLVQMKEYQHPKLNKVSFWTLKQKCEFHHGLLRQTMVPSLLMLSLGK